MYFSPPSPQINKENSSQHSLIIITRTLSSLVLKKKLE